MARPLAFLRFALLLALAAGTTQGQPTSSLARRRAIEDAMRRANAYYQANFALGSAVWNRGAYHGAHASADHTADGTAHASADRDGDRLRHSDADGNAGR